MTVLPGRYESLIGTELSGGYELLELLGAGGMGAVYKARQNDFGTVVAVKLLHPGADMEAANLHRLQREAQVLAELKHPAIPKIHSIKQLNDGGIFIAIDFVEGRSLLAELETNGKMPREIAVNIALQIVDALAHAHERGIIHRDLKPANIMLSGVGKDVRVHVLDFGIAKKLEGSQQFTRTGAIVGTAYYMSPEQARGEAIDQRCDVYSLACVLYEMLTGKRLFEGETQVEVLLRHVQETLPDLNMPEIGPYSAVLGKALAKDPNDRFASMRDFEQALRDPGAVKATQVPRARKIAWKAITALVGAIAAGALVTWLAPKFMPHTKAVMTDKEISYYIRNAWNTKDFSDPHVDDAIAAATDANRDALNANRAVDLELAGDIRVLQHREDEARALYAASLQRSEQANLPGLAVREIAQLEERKDPQAAIKLLRTEVDKSESRHWGRATPALTLRWTLAQKYEFAGMLPDAGEQYKAIFDRAGSSYPFRSIGIIGYADALAQMGRRKEALGMIDSWIKLNESNDPAWEFMPWALNVRAEAETDLKEQEADYTFARRIASSNLQERARYLTDHPTAAQRLWRAKATAELGLAKVLFFKRQFSASDDFMDAALRTCKASGDASLERWVHKQRFVKS